MCGAFFTPVRPIEGGGAHLGPSLRLLLFLKVFPDRFLQGGGHHCADCNDFRGKQCDLGSFFQSVLGFFLFCIFVILLFKYDGVTPVTTAARYGARAHLERFCPGETSRWVLVPWVEVRLVPAADRRVTFQNRIRTAARRLTAGTDQCWRAPLRTTEVRPEQDGGGGLFGSVHVLALVHLNPVSWRL